MADPTDGAGDRVLAALHVLATRNSVGVTELAVELGVGKTVAHRVLGTLVRHGFATRGAERDYRVGPRLREIAVAVDGHALPLVARPHMAALSRATGETVNLSVLDGSRIRFVESVEGTAALRVGDRAGATLPAERSSGGKVLLAALDAAELTARYGGACPDDVARMLSTTRRQGYGINVQETEDGITAVGVAVRDATGSAVAALSIAAPTVRYPRRRVLDVLPQLRASADAIRHDLASPARGR